MQPDEELGYTDGGDVVVGGAAGRVVVGLGAGRVVVCCVGIGLAWAAAVGRCVVVGAALLFGAGAGAATLDGAADAAVVGSAVAGASALVVLWAPTSFCGAGELAAVD